MNYLYFSLYLLNILAIFGLIFIEKRSSNSMIFWLLILIFLPGIGFIPYMIFGKGPKMGMKKKMLYMHQNDEKYLQAINEQLVQSRNNESSETSSLMTYNLNNIGSLCTFNNEVEIFVDINKHYEDLLLEISKAKHTINILYFIIKDDEIGNRLRDVLIKKAKEGVAVNLIYDDLGCIKLSKFFFNEVEKAGGHVYRFLPSIFRLINRNINYRNHRKIVVIDNTIGYCGGANIGDEYVSKDKRITPWRDTHLKIKGNAVNFLNLRFIQDHNFVAEKPLEYAFKNHKTNGKTSIQVISSGPDHFEEHIKTSYIKAIYNAKERVYIQTPYFIPDDAFLEALKAASRSGVDVRIMIPNVPDKKYAYLCTTFYMEELLKFGIKFYKWKGFIHSKTMLVDDEISSVGTFNIDVRSFKLHFEVTCMMFDKKINDAMYKIFLEDMKSSILIDVNHKKKFLQRTLESLMRIFSPLM